MNRQAIRWAATLAVVFGLLALGGCGESREPFVGKFRSVEPYAGKGHIDLELKANGEATWILADEGKTIRFKWKVEDGRLWFYTREGGIIHVTPSEGGNVLTADMTGEWHPACPPNKCLLFKRVPGTGP